mgnify:CR=1 FL=1
MADDDDTGVFYGAKYESYHSPATGQGSGPSDMYPSTKVRDPTVVRYNYADGTDSYANLYKMVVEFQHVPSGQSVFFKAFITSFNESYNSEWASETVFGRTDPIYMFKANSRQIALNLKVPAASESEAFENLGRVQKLTQFLYPTYRDVASGGTVYAQTIAQSPLIRLKVMNLLSRKDGTSTPGPDADANVSYFNKYKGSGLSDTGALGVIQSFQVNHNLENHEAGSIEHGQQTLLPKLIDITVTFNVIHEKTIGWDQNGNPTDPLFPYGVQLDNSFVDRTGGVSFDEHRASLIKEQEDRVLATQAIANAQARYAGMFGKMRMKGDLRRLSSGNLTASEAEYIASALAGQASIEAGSMDDDILSDAEVEGAMLAQDMYTAIGGG